MKLVALVTKRSIARFAAQMAMFVFIVALAAILHPYLIRFKGNLVWIFFFLVILGLLLLPGWPFDRFQKPTEKLKKHTGVKIMRSIPFVEGSRLFVFNTHIGPMDGPKGFRTVAVYQPSPQAAPPNSTGHVIRWLLVLPAAVLAYLLVLIACIGALDAQALNTWGVSQFTLLFAVAMAGAVFAGAMTAPAWHIQAACVLVVLLAAAFVYFTARMAPSGLRDTSLPPTVLGQLAAGFLTTLLVWWNERRRKGHQQPRSMSE